MGIFSGQAQVYQRIFIAVNIVYCAYGYYHVTGNINLVIACADYIALFILNGVHIDSTAGRINCAIAGVGIIVHNINFAAVNVNGAAADVSKQAVAYAGDIYITVYVNGAANCTAVACVCINTCSAVFGKAAVVTVQHYLYVAVDGGAACMAVYAYGMSLACNINIYITVNGQVAFILVNCMCCTACILAVQLNNNLVGLHMAVSICDLGNTCIQSCAVGYVDFQGFTACINNSTIGKIHTSCILAVHIDSGIFGKFIVAVLNCAAQYIFQVSLGITGQSAVEAGCNLMVGSLNIKIGYAGTLAVSAAKENVTCSYSQAVAGQAAGNLHLAVKVSLAVFIVGISQLACQSTQSIVDSFRIDAQALAAGNQVYYGILFRMLDNSIACVEGYAVTCMFIEDVGVAAVIINGQRVAVLLIDITRSSCGRTAGQLSNTAASELFTLIYVCQSSLLLIRPGCTVLQPQVCRTGKELLVAALRCCLAAFREFVIDYAAQLGILRRQTQIYQRILIAVNIVYCAYRYYYVTGNINLIISSTDYIALFILHGVHVDSTAGCIDCAVAGFIIIVNNINLAAVHVNGCTANISKQTVTYAGYINIAIDVNRTAYCSSIACMCINTCCAIFGETAVVAVQLNLHITVDRRAACMAVYAYSRVVALNIDVNVTINRQIAFVLMDCMCPLSALTTVELNHELVCLNRTVCIYILVNARVSLASISYVDSQSFSVGINRRAFNKVRTLSSLAAYVNGSIFSKFVAAVALDYICLCIFLISVCITGKCSGKFGSSGFAIGTLAVIGKLNLAALNGYAVIGQTAGNFYGTKQVFRIICIIRVSQLACQCIQNTVQFCAVFGIYFAAVGYHVDSRILFRIADDDITGSIICGSRAIIVMFIEYSSMTTVIIDINICFIILENQACISFAGAAAELVDMGNAVIFVILRCGKCRQLAQADAIGQGEGLVVPYCVILQPQVNLAGLFDTGIVHNAGPGRFIIGQADIYLTCTVEVRFAVAIVAHNKNVALNNNGFISGCGCIGVNVDSTAVVGDAVKCLGIILRRFNIYITVRGNGRSFKIVGIFFAAGCF